MGRFQLNLTELKQSYINKIDASAKTDNARRIVPIHKELLKPLQEL
jgi:hypothetical protein